MKLLLLLGPLVVNVSQKIAQMRQKPTRHENHLFIDLKGFVEFPDSTKRLS